MAERLWAPWRFTYIDSKEEPGCFLVELPKQDNDRENGILFRGQTAFVIMNAFPYTNGHVMVAPFRHTANLNDLSDDGSTVLVTRENEIWLLPSNRSRGRKIGTGTAQALSSDGKLVVYTSNERTLAVPAEGGDLHVHKADGGAGGVVGVQRREDEVSCEGGADGELGCFAVPDFADHDLVGILPEDGTER